MDTFIFKIFFKYSGILKLINSRGLVVAGIAYLIPDWHQMQLVFSLPLLLLLATYWILPESPR